jgi:hypothetical protein
MNDLKISMGIWGINNRCEGIASPKGNGTGDFRITYGLYPGSKVT